MERAGRCLELWGIRGIICLVLGYHGKLFDDKAHTPFMAWARKKFALGGEKQPPPSGSEASARSLFICTALHLTASLGCRFGHLGAELAQGAGSRAQERTCCSLTLLQWERPREIRDGQIKLLTNVI